MKKEDEIYVMALKNEMLKRGINQEELGKLLGLSSAAVGRWIIGRNGITTSNKLKIKKLCGGVLEPEWFKNQKPTEAAALSALRNNFIDETYKESSGESGVFRIDDPYLQIIAKKWTQLSDSNKNKLLNSFLSMLEETGK